MLALFDGYRTNSEGSLFGRFGGFGRKKSPISDGSQRENRVLVEIALGDCWNSVKISLKPTAHEKPCGAWVEKLEKLGEKFSPNYFTASCAF